MVASTFEDYNPIISRDSFVRRALKEECSQALESCFPDIQVIKPLALVERCHCGPYEWRESYHDEFHLNHFYHDCDFLF